MSQKMTCENRQEPQTLKSQKNRREKISTKLFVVQEHHASHLHWDLRLERDGVLMSWAIPKSPPIEAGVKRLAIQVEDHPVEYATFEGTIPTGLYGAGIVKIWDSGIYELETYSEEKVQVIFHGKKLKGSYVMIKTKFAENSWLLFKLKKIKTDRAET